MRYLAALMFALLFSSIVNAKPEPRVQFAYHSGFLMNLHGFLVDAATAPGEPRWQAVGNADDAQALRDALVFYTANYAKSDLLEDANMQQIKAALSTSDERRNATGLALPPELIAVLNRAAPAYARNFWPTHQAANLQWMRQVRALDTVFGAQIQSDIAAHLAHPFPTRPVRVDVVYRSGGWAGAYTSEDPMQAVLPSERADYQGLAALEMLYHECTHIYVNAALIKAIDQADAAAGRPDTGLWHAVHFYTVGEVVRDVLKQRANIDYVPYADRRIFAGPYKKFMPVLTNVWRPHMRDRTDLRTTVNQMIGQLPPA